MGPGLTTLTRMWRSLRADDRGAQDDRRPLREQRKRFLDREQRALHVDVEHAVELLLRDGPERRVLGDARVGEEHVDAPLRLLHGREEPAPAREIRTAAP